MSTPATIATVRSTHCSELITHEMFAARPSMSAAAKDLDLVYKIAFFQLLVSL
jgi:hypothetical protein